MNKILLISSGLNIAGGLERIVVALANQLCENNYDVTILIVDSQKEIFYSIHDELKIKFMHGNFGITDKLNYLQRKVQFIQDVRRLAKEIALINPEVIISTDYTFTVGITISQLNKKYKIISWEHSTFHFKRSRLWSYILRWSYKKVHCIVALNPDERVHYSKYNSCVKVIPNFIEQTSVVSNLESKEIITIARLDRQKGIDILLKTIPIVLNKHIDWTWRLIAAGDIKKEYKDVITNYGLHKNFYHQYTLTEDVNEYKLASLYVMPSRNELFGMVLIEAMNSGLPCIAFDCNSGPRHIITNHVDGFLVEAENPQKLADAVSVLIENPLLRKQMGIAAKKKAEKFYSESVVTQWSDLLQKLINHPT